MVLFQKEAGLRINAWGYTAAVFSTPLSTIVFGMGIIMIFSDLPLFRGNALFESTRCSRNVWVSGRLLYVIGVSVFYTFVMFLLCLFTSRGELNDTEKWGKILNTIANGYHFEEIDDLLELSITLTGKYTPIQAFGLSFLMCVLCAICLGFCVLLLSMSFGRTIDLLVGCIFSVLDFLETALRSIPWVSAFPYKTECYMQSGYAILSNKVLRADSTGCCMYFAFVDMYSGVAYE